MDELTLEEIHAGTLGILKKLISVCDGIGANYYLAFGSLIGAVRHQGFIPWDDDLDIVMLRPDYEKFRSYCNAHEAELAPFRFFDRHNTPDYPYAIGRFCDTRYRMERPDPVPTAGQGMFIDIYPYDGAGDGSEALLARIVRKKTRLATLLSCAYSTSPVPAGRSKWLTPVRLPLYLYAHAKGPGYFLEKMEAMKDLYSMEESSAVTCMVWDPITRMAPKRWFDGYQMLTFEGIQVKAPADYDSFLRSFYGDYMKLPPEEQRHPYHGYVLYRKEETT